MYPLKKKSELVDCFSKFQRRVENQFERKIKIFHTDGGGEFIASILKNLLDLNEKHQMSCSHIPHKTV